MELKDLEFFVNDYCEQLFKYFPRFKKYLNLVNEISGHILDIYDSEIIPIDFNFENRFDDLQSITLASEIIATINVDLSNLFLSKIRKEEIFFIDDVDDVCSCTYSYNNKSLSQVVRTGDITDALTLIHEFFHNVHLQKYNNNLNNEDFNYFTEIFGIMSDIYAPLYLIYSKKEYINDSKKYLSKLFNGLFNHADISVITGTIMSIYLEGQSLDEGAISRYIIKHNLPDAYKNILYLNKEEEEFNYHETSVYIFALPIAFDLAFNLLCEDNYNIKFIDMFNNITKYKPEDWLHELELDTHFNDSDELLNIMNNIYHNMKDVYGENNVKKLGGL